MAAASRKVLVCPATTRHREQIFPGNPRVRESLSDFAYLKKRLGHASSLLFRPAIQFGQTFMYSFDDYTLKIVKVGYWSVSMR